MYECMYMYTHMYILTCVCVCPRQNITQQNIFSFIGLFSQYRAVHYIYSCIYSCMYECMYTHTHIYIVMCVLVNMLHTSIKLFRTHTCICVYTLVKILHTSANLLEMCIDVCMNVYVRIHVCIQMFHLGALVKLPWGGYE